ncbi:MAG: hypothetical protein GF383_13455 [Candidatus Lokiarchaeota archaeon]|nr:hypothetical protein [Candidatus Lokiarchaeota archaeon]MBD3342207.1 hypothetical protein [Candidatus Lokiarchaeota archaeon]
MNKKILYGIIISSILLMSSAAMMMPSATGATWEFNVPDEAKGIKTQSEVKVYDKDTWGDCLGWDPDSSVQDDFGDDGIGNDYSNDADDVGAQSQTEILGWEDEDEINFFADTLMESGIDDNPFALEKYWDAVPFIDEVVEGWAIPPSVYTFTTAASETTFPAIYAVNYTLGQVNALSGGMVPEIVLAYGNSTISQGLALQGTLERTEAAAKYNSKFEGVILETNNWFFTDEEFEDDPDLEEEENPFIEDPHDLYKSYLSFEVFVGEIFSQMDTVTFYWDNMFNTLAAAKAANTQWDFGFGLITSYDFVELQLNNTIGNNTSPLYFGDTYWQLIEDSDIGNGDWLLGSYVLIQLVRQNLQAYFLNEIPDKAEYLKMLLTSGIPAHAPVDKWLEKVIDDFDINEDQVWGTRLDDDYDTFGGWKMEVDQEGLVITLDFEWTTTDVKDVPGSPYEEGREQKEDYEIVITYGDTGSRSKIEYITDDEVFYSIEGLAPAIPGYEIPVILAIAGLMTIGLIYAVLRKRRM